MLHQRCRRGVTGGGCTTAAGARRDEAFREGERGAGEEQEQEEEGADGEELVGTRAEGVRYDGALRDGDGDEEQEGEEECLEAFLRRLTGEENLGLVENLLLTAVDTSVTQVDSLGELMPHLAELRFGRGSTLASFRDLGSSLVSLRVLWLSACGVCHLDGVGALVGLEELYLAFNDVEDLTSIALHDRLEVLDLESNSVSDVEQAGQLGTCPRLWSLTLTANPVCRDTSYRTRIVEAVPQLATLDDENVTDSDRRPPSPPVEGGPNNLLAGSPQCSSLERVRPLESNSSTITLGAGEEGNRNLRETSVRAPSDDLAVASAKAGGYSFQKTFSRTGGLPIEAFPSCLQFPLEEDLVKCGLEFSDGAQPSYSWMTDSRSIVTSACFDKRESTAGAERGRISEQDSSREENRENQGTGAALSSATPRYRENHLDKQDDIRDWDSAAAAAHLVNEEELVGKAIKALRTTAPKSDSLKWLPEDDRHVALNEKESHDCIKHGREARNPTVDAITEGRLPVREGALKSTHGQGPPSSAGLGKESAPDSVQKGDDWLINFLRIADIGPAADGNAPNGGRSQASSLLTHGSELSIAGNPALGLRRRRTRQRPISVRTSVSSASLRGDDRHRAQTVDTRMLGERPHPVTAGGSPRASARARNSSFAPDTARTGSDTGRTGTTAMVGGGGGVWSSSRGLSERNDGGVEKTTRSGCDFFPVGLAGAAAESSADCRAALIKPEAPGPSSGGDGSCLREAGQTTPGARPRSGNDGDCLRDTSGKTLGERPRSCDDGSVFLRHAGRSKLGSRSRKGDNGNVLDGAGQHISGLPHPFGNDGKFLHSGENKLAARPCNGDDGRNLSHEHDRSNLEERLRSGENGSKFLHDTGDTKLGERPHTSDGGSIFFHEAGPNKLEARSGSGDVGRRKLGARPGSGDDGKKSIHSSDRSKQSTDEDAALTCKEVLSSPPPEDSVHLRLNLAVGTNTTTCFPTSGVEETVALSRSMSVPTPLRTPDLATSHDHRKSRLGWLETSALGPTTDGEESHPGVLETRTLAETTREGENHLAWLEIRKRGEVTETGEGESRLGWLETHKPWETKGDRNGMRLNWSQDRKPRDTMGTRCSRSCQHGRAGGPRERCSGGADPLSADMTAAETDYVVYTDSFADDALVDGELESQRSSYTGRPTRLSQGLLDDDRGQPRHQENDCACHDRTSRGVSETEIRRRGGGMLRPTRLSSQDRFDDDDDRVRRRHHEDESASDTRRSKGEVGSMTIPAGDRDRDAPEWSPGASASSDGGLGFDDSVADNVGDLTTKSVRVGPQITALHRENKNKVGRSVPALHCVNPSTSLTEETETGLHCARGPAAVNGLDEEGVTPASTPWLSAFASRGHVHPQPSPQPHPHPHHHSHPNLHPRNHPHPNDHPHPHHQRQQDQHRLLRLQESDRSQGVPEHAIAKHHHHRHHHHHDRHHRRHQESEQNPGGSGSSRTSSHHRHHHHRQQDSYRSLAGSSEKATTANHRRKSDESGVGGYLERRGTMVGKRGALGDDNRLTPLPREKLKKQVPHSCF